MDNASSPPTQCTDTVKKAIQLIFMIKLSLQNLAKSVFIAFNGALMDPHVEYCMQKEFAKSRGRNQTFGENSRIGCKTDNWFSSCLLERLQRPGLHSLDLQRVQTVAFTGQTCFCFLPLVLYLLILASVFTRGGLSRHHQLR